MKKIALLLIVFLAVQLCGCVSIPLDSGISDVKTLTSWSFQYNEGTDDYSVFFGLLTESQKYVSADVNVDVRIVNDNNEEVYKGTHSVDKDDFNYYTSQVSGEQYLANLRIPADRIEKGTSVNGKVYITVYKGNELRFEEVNCEAFYCLPVKGITLIAQDLPKEISIKGYDGNVESVVEISEVQYSFDQSITPKLEIVVIGKKIYGEEDSVYDVIAYKMYDSEGFMVESGNIYLDSLSEGDKFRDDSLMIYDVVPGESYTIVFSESVW